MRFKLSLAALAATAAFASPAMAQTVASATGDARGTILQPLTVLQLQELDFGTVLASAVSGCVTIPSDGSPRTVGCAGGVTPMSLDAGQRGEFGGDATLGQLLEITLTPPPGGTLTRTGGSETISARDWDLDGGPLGDTFQTRTVTDPDGAYLIGVGATFDIAAGQVAGLYTAQYDVTVEYN